MKRNKLLFSGFGFLILFICFLYTVPVFAANADLSVKATIEVYSISGEEFLRDTHSIAYSVDDLSQDEYLSFSFLLTNKGSSPYGIDSCYVRVNGGERLEWNGFVIQPGVTVQFHIYYVHMKKYGPGTYDVDFYINGNVIASQVFTVTKNWNKEIRMPSASEISAFSSSSRSPYIAVYPEFPSAGFNEYAVDFRADYLPRGTYLSVLNWGMTPGSLSKTYSRIRDDGNPLAYAGFQVHDNGTHAAILSVWDTYCTDYNGKNITVRAERIYPDSCMGGDTFDGEGEGVHCIVPYNWKEGHTYRALIQQGTAPNGNTTVALWACDLESNQWTRLIEYDIKRTDTHMTWGAAFLENYVPQYAGEIRTMALSNIRARNAASGQWEGITRTDFYENFEYPGSYNYGSDDSVFWAITTGIPNRCTLPAQGKNFTVRYASSTSPY